jgi:hypothetical protein
LMNRPMKSREMSRATLQVPIKQTPYCRSRSSRRPHQRLLIWKATGRVEGTARSPKSRILLAARFSPLTSRAGADPSVGLPPSSGWLMAMSECLIADLHVGLPPLRGVPPQGLPL